MKNDNRKNVSIPRWHYRDTTAEVQVLLNRAEGSGNLRDAMIEYINRRQDKLPEGVTAERAVDSILRTAGDFVAATLEGKTKEDIGNALKENIAELEPRQAVAYLAALEATFRSCDCAVCGGEIPTPETLGRELGEAAENASEDEIPGRIEKLAGMILGDSLNANVFASGNDEIADILRDEDIANGNISADTANAIHRRLCDDRRKAEVYAATSCVCYGMVLDGKIEGISADKLDAGVLTALVSAGMEKASILTRLFRGEIDKELAIDMLTALAKALKWVLVKALQVVEFFIGGVIGIIAANWLLGLVGIAVSAWWLLAIGVAVGIFFAIENKDDIEDFIDFLGKLVMIAKQGICEVLNWCWEKGKEMTGNTDKTAVRTDPRNESRNREEATC